MDETGKTDGSEPLRIRIYPEDVLLRKALAVRADGFGEDLALLASRMIETMRTEVGVGLAAPQVGASLRLVVVDATAGRDKPLILVNPRVVDASGRDLAEEGCLSVPGINAKVRRRERVAVEYDTLEGRREGVEADGLLARVFQHELDHLDGTLFVDRLGPAGKMRVRDALRELRERAPSGR